MINPSLCTYASVTYAPTVGTSPLEVTAVGADYSLWSVREKRDGVLVLVVPDSEAPGGFKLQGRSGGYYNAPAEWLRQFRYGRTNENTDWVLQGELCGFDPDMSFAEVGGIARTLQPDMQQWKRLTVACFDVVLGGVAYAIRAEKLHALYENNLYATGKADFRAFTEIPYAIVESNESLLRICRWAFSSGREGIVLYDSGAMYKAGKTGAMQKIVSYYREEATIIKHISGGGRHKGRLGAYLLKTMEAPEIVFSVGTGMTDYQREHPDPVGSIVTFMHKGRGGIDNNNKGYKAPCQPSYVGRRLEVDRDGK